MAALQGQGGWCVDIGNTGHIMYAADSETTLGRIPDGQAGQVLTFDPTQPGFASWTSISSLPSAAPLTVANDTNITLTLGGTPLTALLAATSITAGWSGTLSTVRGGTGASSLAAASIVTGSGTTGKLPKWTNGPSGVLGDSVIAEASGVLTATGSLNIVATNVATAALSARYNSANFQTGFIIANANGFAYIGNNLVSVVSSDQPNYDLTGTATQLRVDSGMLRFFSAPSGTAGTAVTLTQQMQLDTGGNLEIEVGQGRFKGWYASGPVSGLAAEIGISGGAGYLLAYNRTTATWANLNLQANATIFTLNPTNNTATFSGCSVGIGVTPTQALDVVGNAHFSTGATIFAAGTSDFFIRAGASASLNLGANDTNTLLKLFASGGLSLGNTTDPGAGNLSVTGIGIFSLSLNGDETLQISNSNTGASARAYLRLSGNATNSYLLKYGTGNTSGLSGIASELQLLQQEAAPIVLAATNASGDIRIFTGGTTERARFCVSGGFAVGTSSDPGAGNAHILNELDAATVIATTLGGNVLQIGGARAISNSGPTITAHVGGTGPTISGTDNSFAVVMNNATSVTVTFGTAFSHAPNPGVSYSVAGLANQGIAVTTSTCIITGAGVAATVFVTLIGW